VLSTATTFSASMWFGTGTNTSTAWGTKGTLSIINSPGGQTIVSTATITSTWQLLTFNGTFTSSTTSVEFLMHGDMGTGTINFAFPNLSVLSTSTLWSPTPDR